MAAAVAAATAHLAVAAEYHLQPGGSFEQSVESLQPGDTLFVHAGTYSDTGRISIAARGTASAPILIQGAPGEARPHITRPAGATAQNTINIEGATYLTIRGLEISSNGGDGINLNSQPSYIVLEDLHIHDVDVGVNFRSSMNNITVRRAHIHDTGQDGGTGEGMYIGCNNAECAVSNSLIEGNWIHNTRNSTQGDGIELKRGSFGNIIRDNVIHDTQYPCILLYGSEGNARNIVEGNVMWNCDDAGIQAAADSLIRNNIIIATTGDGFNSQPHQGVTPANLEFTHNTLISSSGDVCVRLNGWNGRPGLVFANNAVYCTSGSFSLGGLTSVVVTGNVIQPSGSGFPSSGNTTGRSLALDFVAAAARNYYPSDSSVLIDAGAATYQAAGDFNGTARSGTPEAGAYTRTTATNPGWTVVSGFKPMAGSADTVAPAPPTELQVQ